MVGDKKDSQMVALDIKEQIFRAVKEINDQTNTNVRFHAEIKIYNVVHIWEYTDDVYDELFESLLRDWKRQ